MSENVITLPGLEIERPGADGAEMLEVTCYLVYDELNQCVCALDLDEAHDILDDHSDGRLRQAVEIVVKVPAVRVLRGTVG
jgi:hypothetical protein